MDFVFHRTSVAPRSVSVVQINQIWNVLSLDENKKGLYYCRLAQVLAEEHSSVSKAEWCKLIRDAVWDGLLDFWVDKNLIIVISLPVSDFTSRNLGDRDWFCFNCHKPGDVVRCQHCSKSFHAECLPEDLRVVTAGVMEGPCSFCQVITTTAGDANKPDTGKLNEILVLITTQVMGWEMEFLNDCSRWASMLYRSANQDWRYSYLIYSSMDVTIMNKKAIDGRYMSLEEFELDCKTLLHNIGIFFGFNEQISIGLSFYTQTKKAIEAIKLCQDCVHNFKTKTDDTWFSKPCTIPHEIVWADTPGIPLPVPWPAKVLKRFEGNCTVRFFGPKNKKVLPESHINPITTVVDQFDQLPEWKKAVQELKLYQQLSLE